MYVYIYTCKGIIVKCLDYILILVYQNYLPASVDRGYELLFKVFDFKSVKHADYL